MARDGVVSLTIYDVKGRLVKTLINGPMAEGHHDVDWYGRDIRGRQVASGVYYYRITSGSFTATKAMTLLK